jgi:hypothetical protein
VAAAASDGEFRPAMGEHLDPGLGGLRIDCLVALVGDEDAGLERDDIVAVVPLVPLGVSSSPPGRNRMGRSSETTDS